MSREYKKTPIGEIPEDWEVVRLIDHVNVLKGFAFSSKFFNDDGKGLPLIRIRDLGKNATEAYYSGPYDSEYLVNPGDILVSMDGEFNVFIWKGPRGLLNQRVAKIESKSPKLDQGYLYYALKKPLKIIEAQTSHTTVKHLLDKDIKRIQIPLPPLPEQRKIAEILRTVDEAIEKTDLAIERTERLKKGLMKRLLTRGIKHERFKKTELGEIPEEWRVVRLGEIGKLSSGKPRPHEVHDSPSDSFRFPVFGGNGILGYAREFLIDYDTIVIGRVGEYCGAVYKVPSKAWITDNALYFQKISKELDLDFLSYYLSWMNLNRFKRKSGQPLLTQSTLYGLKLAVPSLSEQKQIAEILSTVDKKLELLRKRKEKLERIKRGLMKDLLTGRRRVHVTTEKHK